MKIEFSSKRRELLLLLFLTTSIVPVTSREKQANQSQFVNKDKA